MVLQHSQGEKKTKMSEGPRDRGPVSLGGASGLVPKNSWEPLTEYEQNKDVPSKGQFGGS